MGNRALAKGGDRGLASVLGLFRLVLPRGRCPNDRHHSANPLGCHVDAVRGDLRGLVGQWPKRRARPTDRAQDAAREGRTALLARKAANAKIECWQF
jgi:hypothetical protein